MSRIRPFYNNSFLYLILGIIIVVWGFYNSYFARLGEMPLPYHVHGVSATMWITLMVVQPLLYR